MSKLTKEKFDGIIKSNLINFKSDVSANNFGYKIEGRNFDLYYEKSWFESFVNSMANEIRDRYGREIKPKGNEPPHMASVGSSSHFCYIALKDIEGVEFEKDCPIFYRAVPHIDAYIPQEDCEVFVEVKCHEIFDSHKTKMSKKYGKYFKENDIFTELIPKDWTVDKELSIPLNLLGVNKKCSFDVKQFICHLLGIAANRCEKPAKLVYLFFIPVVDDEETAGEIKEVFDQLQSEIKALFTSEPIMKFCKAKNISLSAIAEKSRTMEALSAENMVVLY